MSVLRNGRRKQGRDSAWVLPLRLAGLAPGRLPHLQEAYAGDVPGQRVLAIPAGLMPGVRGA